MSFINFKLSLWLFLCLVGIASSELDPNYYLTRCPLALTIIKNKVTDAVLTQPRMGASLLRLHFHDCFVQGCDASVLLNDTDSFTGEKTAFPNANSLRGFDVIDNIKSQLESPLVCPGTVSCADILAVAARDSVVALGGPTWTVGLGRRDSTTANITAANTDLPAPFLGLDGLITAFAKKGLNATDLVALSGAHTIGKARCLSFRSRIYNDTNIDSSFATSLQVNCTSTGGDDNLSPLDSTTENFFDNAYYKNLVNKKGLLHSDQELFNGGSTDSLAQTYIDDPSRFEKDFVNAMIKMSNLSPLMGTDGQIRTKCYQVN